MSKIKKALELAQELNGLGLSRDEWREALSNAEDGGVLSMSSVVFNLPEGVLLAQKQAASNKGLWLTKTTNGNTETRFAEFSDVPKFAAAGWNLTTNPNLGSSRDMVEGVGVVAASSGDKTTEKREAALTVLGAWIDEHAPVINCTGEASISVMFFADGKIMRLSEVLESLEVKVPIKGREVESYLKANQIEYSKG
jgi:hypothetical protein